MTDTGETNVGQLRLIGGTRQPQPRTLGTATRRGLLPSRARGKGQLYVLVELSGEVFGREEMCQELVASIVEEYFRTPGTVTYGLRQAVLLANTQLQRTNARVTSEHRHGGVACIVLRAGEVFIAQAGWPMVYVVHGEFVEAYPQAALDIQENRMLGQHQTIEVRLFRASVRPGDMILAADGPMARQLGITRIGQIVSGGVERAMANLETLAPPEDCTALVLEIGASVAQPQGQREQWTFMPVERPQAAAGPARQPMEEPPPAAEPSRQAAAEPSRQPVEEPPRQPVAQPPPMRQERAPAPEPIDTATRTETAAAPTHRERVAARRPATPPPPAGPTAGERAQAALSALTRGARTLGERLLPDQEPRAAPQRRRASRARRARGQAVGRPNLGIAAALAIPVLALIIVGAYMMYRNWSSNSQFETIVEAARLKRDIAISNAESPALARDDWVEVIALAKEASALQPEDAEVQQLRNQAATEIDRIDGVTRLGQAYKLYEYTTPGSTPSRVVVAVLDVYVLDRGTGRVYRHTLNETRNALTTPDADQVLLQEAQPVEGENVGMLVDIAWMKDGGERQAGALLILDRNGLLIEYDPSWGQMTTQSLGGRDIWRSPLALRTFDSNLYVLDTMANQILKYPEQAFAGAPVQWLQAEVDLADAIDMGIDGSIYLVRNNGELGRYYAGEATEWAVTRMPKPFLGADALYMDEDDAQYLYIADASESRIVQLDREGGFIRQFRPPAEVEASFQQLSGLFVDETAGKLYYTTANALYVTDLPHMQR